MAAEALPTRGKTHDPRNYTPFRVLVDGPISADAPRNPRPARALAAYLCRLVAKTMRRPILGDGAPLGAPSILWGNYLRSRPN